MTFHNVISGQKTNREKPPTSGCASTHPTLPRELRGGRVTFDDVTSGQKAPLGCIFPNFRLRMRTPFFWSLPVALSVMRNGSFCTATIVRKNTGNGCACERDHFCDFRFRSGPLPVTLVTSLPVTLVTSLPVAPPDAPPEILLESCWYTTVVSCPQSMNEWQYKHGYCNSRVNKWQQEHGEQDEWMFVANWLIAEKAVICWLKTVTLRTK